MAGSFGVCTENVALLPWDQMFVCTISQRLRVRRNSAGAVFVVNP